MEKIDLNTNTEEEREDTTMVPQEEKEDIEDLMIGFQEERFNDGPRDDFEVRGRRDELRPGFRGGREGGLTRRGDGPRIIRGSRGRGGYQRDRSHSDHGRDSRGEFFDRGVYRGNQFSRGEFRGFRSRGDFRGGFSGRGGDRSGFRGGYRDGFGDRGDKGGFREESGGLGESRPFARGFGEKDAFREEKGGFC